MGLAIQSESYKLDMHEAHYHYHYISLNRTDSYADADSKHESSTYVVFKIYGIRNHV
jgi:hypothetical protein